eukprot:163206-Chlamydomonas_euryale.AAC.9
MNILASTAAPWTHGRAEIVRQRCIQSCQGGDRRSAGRPGGPLCFGSYISKRHSTCPFSGRIHERMHALTAAAVSSDAARHGAGCARTHAEMPHVVEPHAAGGPGTMPARHSSAPLSAFAAAATGKPPCRCRRVGARWPRQLAMPLPPASPAACAGAAAAAALGTGAAPPAEAAEAAAAAPRGATLSIGRARGGTVDAARAVGASDMVAIWTRRGRCAVAERRGAICSAEFSCKLRHMRAGIWCGYGTGSTHTRGCARPGSADFAERARHGVSACSHNHSQPARVLEEVQQACCAAAPVVRSVRFRCVRGVAHAFATDDPPTAQPAPRDACPRTIQKQSARAARGIRGAPHRRVVGEAMGVARS